MWRLVVTAWTALLVYDCLALGGFATVRRSVAGFPRRPRVGDEKTVQRVCRAVDEACVWYVKRAYCLQRSAVAAWMLRWHGVPAVMVIGYRPVPVDSHAWVEVDGRVVNDRPQYQRAFRVLDTL